MKNEQKLSHQSNTFIEDLRVYLFSSGKNEREIKEITEELEVHLQEAEQKGKSIEKIIGNSPKEYMEMISKEMSNDYLAWMKYIVIILLGMFSLNIIPELLNGILSYSVLEIIGHIVIALIFITFTFASFKYISVISHSNKKKLMLLSSVAFTPIILFIGLIYLNRAFETPIVHFNQIALIITGAIAVLIIIGISFWAKSWVLIILLLLLSLPDYFLGKTSITDETQLIVSGLITYGGIGLYIWFSYKQHNKSQQ
ncbi:hypothetical protein SH601_09500 [Gracilibacillus sp. S3-1-1]|uniref:Uncharacterized protein n=1 Tax=Gracilibacillus pellucidus TaxID=3095368 RepID=A0ACC6M5H4_9BACI|nr:hypothetical protein [Gracilibacillus sp. S3-1-1]MDX8046225.1 hypothetical protein [Gracilibacillus sp. S3-1-1]